MALAAEFRISTWTAEFVDGTVEQAFREESRDALIRQTRVAIGLAALFYFLFAVTDYFAVVGGEKYPELFIVRMLVLLFGLSIAFSAERHWRALVNGVTPTLTILFAMTGFISITLLRAYAPGWHGMSFMVMLLGSYVFIPNRFMAALAVCLLASVMFMAKMLSHFDLPLYQTFNFSLLLFCMNLFGAITAHRISWTKRDAYRLTRTQREANRQLVEEIETRSRLESELREQALHDPLTGLPNRRFFLSELQNRMSACQRDGRALWLLFVDIDYFRQINATYGYVAGDGLLCHLAKQCRDLAPAEAMVARISGEELVLLVPGIAKADAVTLAETLRLCVQNGTVKSLDTRLYFTVSVGIAEAGEQDSTDLFVSRADRALREAKYAGRNRVKAA